MGNHSLRRSNSFGQVVQEEMSFNEKAYTWPPGDGGRPITIAHLEPLAQVS